MLSVVACRWLLAGGGLPVGVVGGGLPVAACRRWLLAAAVDKSVAGGGCGAGMRFGGDWWRAFFTGEKAVYSLAGDEYPA